MPQPTMMFKVNDSLTAQIASHLEQRIIVGEMQGGERIQELRIAAELEVSRGSVREALLLLQRRHLVEIYPRRGAVVARISAQDIRDFFDLWLMLLQQAVSSLADNWKEDELAHLAELTRQMAASQQRHDGQSWYQQAMDFLQALYDNTPNRYLASTLKDLFAQTRRCLYAIMRTGQEQAPQAQQFFEHLLAAIIARNQLQLQQIIHGFGSNYSVLAQAAAKATDNTGGK
jgi:DNA-binding GntR family transcriptional regulator